MKGGAIIPQTDSAHPPPRQVKAVQNIQPPPHPPHPTPARFEWARFEWARFEWAPISGNVGATCRPPAASCTSRIFRWNGQGLNGQVHKWGRPPSPPQAGEGRTKYPTPPQTSPTERAHPPPRPKGGLLLSHSE